MGKIVSMMRQRGLDLDRVLNTGARGFSLIEILVVMALLSILLTISTLSFKEYARRYRTEAQTRLLYSELLKARVDAICQRKTIRVKLYPGRFEVYSSQWDDSSGAKPLQMHPLSYPVICKAKHGEPVSGYIIDFQKQGVALNEGTICIESSDSSGAVDSIKFSATRISVGKRKDKVDGCDKDDITFK